MTSAWQMNHQRKCSRQQRFNLRHREKIYLLIRCVRFPPFDSLWQEDLRHAAGQVWAKEAITDLGQPSTPRKEGREDGAEETEPIQQLSTLGNRSVVADLVFSEGRRVSSTSNAPMADSALSSIGGAASTRQDFGPNSVVINVHGEMAAKLELTDVRKQLMKMGLFPPEFYRVGESFEEMRQRYVVCVSGNFEAASVRLNLVSCFRWQTDS